jgi:hypothetical protein
MSSTDTNFRSPESIVPWKGEAGRIAELMELRGGEWVVAAAFLDYTYFSETLTIAELEEEAKIQSLVETAAVEIISVIPPKQMHDVFKLSESLLEDTVGHYAVYAMYDALKIIEEQCPKPREPRVFYL